MVASFLPGYLTLDPGGPVVFALSPAQLRIAPFSYKFWSGPRGGPLDIDVVDLRPGQFAVFRQDEVHSGGPASEDEAVRLHM